MNIVIVGEGMEHHNETKCVPYQQLLLPNPDPTKLNQARSGWL